MRALLLTAALLSATPALAQTEDEPRLLVGIEGDLLFAVGSPQVDRYLPGPSLAGSLQLSLTKWIMPVLRVRGGLLTMGTGQTDLGTLGSVTTGIRFRPRGIAHP